ncbi:hypothetical protein BJY59DRAFT_692597 [Rhodotorula toruloides]
MRPSPAPVQLPRAPTQSRLDTPHPLPARPVRPSAHSTPDTPFPCMTDGGVWCVCRSSGVRKERLCRSWRVGVALSSRAFGR